MWKSVVPDCRHPVLDTLITAPNVPLTTMRVYNNNHNHMQCGYNFFRLRLHFLSLFIFLNCSNPTCILHYVREKKPEENIVVAESIEINRIATNYISETLNKNIGKKN